MAENNPQLAIGLQFEWTEQREQVAIALAHGKSKIEAASEAGITRITIYNWLKHPDFCAEVDRLSCMVGIAAPAARLRILNRLVRQRIRPDGTIDSKADIVELIKLAIAETGNLKLDLLMGSNTILETKDEESTPPPTPSSEPELSSEQVS